MIFHGLAINLYFVGFTKDFMSSPEAHLSVSTLNTTRLMLPTVKSFLISLFVFNLCTSPCTFWFFLGHCFILVFVTINTISLSKKTTGCETDGLFEGTVFITLSFWHFYGSGITGPSASLQPLLEAFYRMNNLWLVHLHAKHFPVFKSLFSSRINKHDK